VARIDQQWALRQLQLHFRPCRRPVFLKAFSEAARAAAQGLPSRWAACGSQPSASGVAPSPAIHHQVRSVTPRRVGARYAEQQIRTALLPQLPGDLSGPLAATQRQRSGKCRESPRRRSGPVGSECIIPEPGAAAFNQQAQRARAWPRTRLRPTRNQPELFSKQPRPGRRISHPPALGAESAAMAGDQVQVENDAALIPKAIGNKPINSQPASFPARCTNAANRPECGGLPPYQKRLGLGTCRRVIQQQASPPATGMGMVRSKTRGRRSKANESKRAQASAGLADPAVETSHRCVAAEHFPLSPTGPGVVAASNHSGPGQ